MGALPPADDELDRRRSLAAFKTLGARLVAEVGKDSPRVRQCFELGLQGHDEPAEQARILDRPIAEIYEARKAIKYHARRIRDEWDAAEEQRMHSLREGRLTAPEETKR